MHNYRTATKIQCCLSTSQTSVLATQGLNHKKSLVEKQEVINLKEQKSALATALQISSGSLDMVNKK